MRLSESRIKSREKTVLKVVTLHITVVYSGKKQGILLNNVVNFQAMIYLYCRVEIEFMAKTSLLQKLRVTTGGQ